MEAENSASFVINRLMSKSMIFRVCSLFFLTGVAAGSFRGKEAEAAGYVLLLFSLIVFFIFYKNKKTAVAALACVFFAAGLWRIGSEFEKIKSADGNGKKIFVSAAVVREPESRENYQNVVAKTEDGAVVLIHENLGADINYGDELKIECVLAIPENKKNGFDYRMHLAKEKIDYLCRNARTEKIGENKGNKFYAFILRLKNKMEENISAAVPYPHSALANGLLFGGSAGLPAVLKEHFSRTGLTHIVAVSGFNVTIIAEYLLAFGIFIGLWRKQAFWFAVAGIFLFVAMIGFPASAARAGIMGVLLIWAMKNGRLANSWNAIFCAAAAMLFFNPLLLRWDVGFQLSFLATTGIVAFSPFFERYVVKKHRAMGFAEIIFLTLSAQIFVLPVILFNFHQLSLVFLAANILILPIVPLTMLFSFLAAAVGLVWHNLSLIFAWSAFLLLKYEIWIAGSLAEISWASREIKNFGWMWVLLWYVFLFALIFAAKKSKRWN